MDDWFCESRNHRREAQLRAEDLAQLNGARASAPGPEHGNPASMRQVGL